MRCSPWCLSEGWIGRSASAGLSPRRYAPAVHDRARTAHDDLVVEVAHHADVVRHDPEALANLGLSVATGQVEHAMLLVQPFDDRVRVFEDQAVAGPGQGRDLVARQALRAR